MISSLFSNFDFEINFRELISTLILKIDYYIVFWEAMLELSQFHSPPPPLIFSLFSKLILIIDFSRNFENFEYLTKHRITKDWDIWAYKMKDAMEYRIMQGVMRLMTELEKIHFML